MPVRLRMKFRVVPHVSVLSACWLVAACSAGTAEGTSEDSQNEGSGGGGNEASGGAAGSSNEARAGGSAGARANEGAGGSAAAEGGRGGAAVEGDNPDAGLGPEADASAKDPPAGTIPVFVAQAFGALTVVSCDDGKTWNKVRQENSSNDDHADFSSQGLAYGDGAFVGVFGWGAPSTAWVSTDAQTWTRTYGNGNFESMGDVAFGRGAFLAGGNRWSFDNGKTWKVTRGNGSRRTFFVDYGPGRFLIADSSLNYTDDLGATWKPASGSLACSSLWHFGGYIVQSAGITVIVDAERNVCRSTDGGATMTKVATLGSSGQIGKVLVADGIFHAFCTDGSVYRSSDGVTWQPFAHKPMGAKPHIVARSTAGTFAGTDGQKFYRSPDGLNWTQSGNFSGARFSELTFGYTRRPAVCPQ